MTNKAIGIIHWFQNVLAPGSNPPSGAYLYAESGLLKVRQADGIIVTIANAPIGTTQLWTGGNASTVFTNNTPAVRCGGAS